MKDKDINKKNIWSQEILNRFLATEWFKQKKSNTNILQATWRALTLYKSYINMDKVCLYVDKRKFIKTLNVWPHI